MYTYKIEVDRVVDGDTIDAIIDLGFDVSVKKRIRFMGVNAPESRTRDADEKVRGLAAKKRVEELLQDAEVITVKSHGVGKFGRCLGELILTQAGEDVNLNELLISEGHAVEYFGGKRYNMKSKICKWVMAITFGLICFNWCACCCGADNCCKL